MTKYRVRGAEYLVEAMQWVGNNLQELISFVGPALKCHGADGVYLARADGSRLHLDLNSWAVKSGDGEFYPCTSDVFEATYELVAEGEQNG